MALIGDLFPPGTAAPANGTYQCSYSGCTISIPDVKLGIALPPAHHLGAAWKLAQITSEAARAPGSDPLGKPAGAAPPQAGSGAPGAPPPKPAVAAPPPVPASAPPKPPPAQAPWKKKPGGAPEQPKKK